MSGTTPSDPGEPRRWFDLELRLLLLGTEELAVRPGLRAFRDRGRPRVWDRQIAVAGSGSAGSGTRALDRVQHDLAALDRFYREIRAEQWSLVAYADDTGLAWEDALASRGFSRERVALMARAPRSWPPSERAIAPPARLVRLEGPAGFTRLAGLLRAATESATGVGNAADQVLEVVAARSASGFPCAALAIEAGGRIAASITMTTLAGGERVWLEDLMVEPARRRHGLARRLLRAAESEARASGARRVGFSAQSADWPAIWYARDGFEFCGESVRLRRLW